MPHEFGANLFSFQRGCRFHRKPTAPLPHQHFCPCVGKEEAARDSGIQFMPWQLPISLPWGCLTAGWPWLQQEPWWETSGRQWNSRHFLLHLQDSRAKSRRQVEVLVQRRSQEPQSPPSHSSCFPSDNPVSERMYAGPIVSSMQLTTQ